MDILKDKVVLITGGSGFLGSHLVDYLIQNCKLVINLDKIDYCSFNNTYDNYSVENYNMSNYKFIHGNTMNKELVSLILNTYNVNIIYHLASQTHVDNSFYNSINFTYDNIVGTHILLECIREYSLKNDNKLENFIHMSTDEVYGEIIEGGLECTENSVLKPTNPYAATKAGAELLAFSYFKSYKLPIKIVRCNNIYGPRQYPEKVIPAFIYNLISNKKCLIQGSGKNLRHFIYVTDVVNALILINNKGIIGEIYNISSDFNYKVIDLAKILIKKIKGNEVDINNYIEYIEDRNFNDYRYLINSKKLEELGYKQEIKFQEGLEKTIEYFKNYFNKLN